ncbi:MAG: hypothetical protein QXJ68_00065 [Methanocellales archaeon]
MNDEKAWVDYMLYSTGILFAGSILLIAICGVYKLTIPSNEQILLQSIALEVVEQIMEVDLKPFPYNHSLKLKAGYDISISCEYITVSNSNSNYVRPLLIHVYPAKNSFWNNTTEMRSFLKKEFGHSGSEDDKLETGDEVNLSRIFHLISLNTFDFKWQDKIWLEKSFIYFDNGERKGYVFIQRGRSD